MHVKNRQLGQATIEYLFILVFVAFMSTKAVNMFSGFMGDQLGGLAKVLSKHLSVGVCSRSCMLTGYRNGENPDR